LGEAQGAAAVKHGVVEKVIFPRVAVCFHRGDHDSKEICEGRRFEEPLSRRPVQRCAALPSNRAVDRVPERRPISRVETDHRRQRGSGVEVQQVSGVHGRSTHGRQWVQDKFQARGRTGQQLMIKLARQLPTKIEITCACDHRHQVDVATAWAIIPERQGTGRVDTHHAPTEDLADTRRYRVKVMGDFFGDSCHPINPTPACGCLRFEARM
jgi:hypothetical protein